MIASNKTNLDQEIREFNQVNEQIEEQIQQIQEDFDTDVTPVKRTRKQTREPYVSSFKNNIYTNIQEILASEQVDEATFVQMLQQVFNQISLKKGINIFGNKTVKDITKKL